MKLEKLGPVGPEIWSAGAKLPLFRGAPNSCERSIRGEQGITTRKNLQQTIKLR